MNKDELKNLVPIAVAVLAPFAAKVGISHDLLAELITDGGAAGLALYLHWNMRKVPEDQVADSDESGDENARD